MGNSNNWFQENLVYTKQGYYIYKRKVQLPMVLHGNSTLMFSSYSYYFSLYLFLLLFSFFFHSPFFFLSSPLYSCLFILIFIAVLLPVEFLGIFCSLLLISSPLLSWNFDFWECLYYSNCLLCIQCGRG